MKQIRLNLDPHLKSNRKPGNKELRITDGERGYSYRTLFFDYLQGVKKVTIEDSFIRHHYQIINFLRFCELCAIADTVKDINLVTTTVDCDLEKKQFQEDKLNEIVESLLECEINLSIEFSNTLHDRRIELDNGWVITLGRGLDIYKPLEHWFKIGANELDLRRCHETTIVFHRAK